MTLSGGRVIPAGRVHDPVGRTRDPGGSVDDPGGRTRDPGGSVDDPGWEDA